MRKEQRSQWAHLRCVCCLMCSPKAWVLGDCLLLTHFQLIEFVNNNPRVRGGLQSQLWWPVQCWRSVFTETWIIERKELFPGRAPGGANMFYNKGRDSGGASIKQWVWKLPSDLPKPQGSHSDSPTDGFTGTMRF